MGPLTRDVMTAYYARTNGQAPTWTPLPVQYADYSLWQREVLGSEDDPQSMIAKQIAFWSDALADLPEQLDLPGDRPRPEIASGRGANHSFTIEPQLWSELDELAKATNATPFMVVHSASGGAVGTTVRDDRHCDRCPRSRVVVKPSSMT